MRFAKYILYLLPIIVFIVIQTGRQMEAGKIGTKSNPVKIYFTPSVDANRISLNAVDLIKYLEAETGYYFTSAYPASYIAVVEAFGSNKADIAMINTFSYLMVNEMYGAEARLRIVRDQGETTYRGQIIVRTDSGIDSLADLKGKSFAFVDASSTSGYILPKSMLEKRGITLGETVFGMRHDNVVMMVYQRQVDAGATYYSPPDRVTGQIYDARMRVEKQYPDAAKKLKILALTEKIPNDPFVFRKNMPEEMKKKIADALVKFVQTPIGKKAMYEISDIRGLVYTTDGDYDPLRKILKEQNLSLKNLVKK
jgi:phosphonate transport system substrate-binding protein